MMIFKNFTRFVPDQPRYCISTKMRGKKRLSYEVLRLDGRFGKPDEVLTLVSSHRTESGAMKKCNRLRK